jgi:membrane-bound serine protease (ClpP class)
VTIAILLLVVGLVLIVLELMFPTMGALGVAAALCLIGAIAFAFGRDSATGVWFLVATAVLVPTAIVLGFRLLPHSPLGKVLVNRGTTFTDVAAVDTRDRTLVGKIGTAENLLRPVGTIYVDGRRVDVVTRGEPIEAGARVRVIEVEGNRVVVAREDPAPPVAPAASNNSSSL